MTLQMLTEYHLSPDPAQVDFTGDAGFGAGQRWCGGQAPVVLSNGTRMTLMFRSDDLFRYQVPLTPRCVSTHLGRQGFSCRYRALLPNGDAVPGSFGNSTDGAQSGLTSNNFLQVTNTSAK